MREGHIVDTVVYYLSLPLQDLPRWLAAEGMLVVQNLINFVIPSGSGQAVVTMPIMAPLSDVLGISRQVAVLAFQFGDGLSNLLWPTALIPIMCAIAHVPLDNKCSMAGSGLFDGYDLAIMIHSCGGFSTTAFRSLAMDGYRFTFKGRASHAAGAPWEGKNALNGVQLMFHAVDMLRQHTIPEARMHGVFDYGGAAPNIVPDRAVCRFEFRAPTRSYLDGLTSRCLDCARGAALATGTEVSWEKFESSFDEMIPNQPGESMIGEIYSELGIPFDPPVDPTGSTDVGNVSQRCPALQPLLAITPGRYALHTVEFAESVTGPEAHDALLLGAKVIGRAVVKTILDRELAASMRQVIPKK